MNFVWFRGELVSVIERSSRCCIRIITSPNPNSTAEKIKKKNVSDSMFTLSKNKPMTRTRT